MKREKGFTLFIVIILLVFISLAVGLLGNISTNFADKAVLSEIKVRNNQMLHSGRAWVRNNVDKLGEMAAGERVSLDTGEFSGINAGCFVKVVDVGDKAIKAEITVEMSKGRINSSKTIPITLNR